MHKSLSLLPILAGGFIARQWPIQLKLTTQLLLASLPNEGGVSNCHAEERTIKSSHPKLEKLVQLRKGMLMTELLHGIVCDKCNLARAN
jgi:hypothetical protein